MAPFDATGTGWREVHTIRQVKLQTAPSRMLLVPTQTSVAKCRRLEARSCGRGDAGRVRACLSLARQYSQPHSAARPTARSAAVSPAQPDITFYRVQMAGRSISRARK
jgi:hypothetical protein